MTHFEARIERLVQDLATRLTKASLEASRGMVDAAFQSSAEHRHRPDTPPSQSPDPFGKLAERRLPLPRALREFERLYLARALREHGGNITHTAAALGIPRQVLQRHLRRIRGTQHQPRRTRRHAT